MDRRCFLKVVGAAAVLGLPCPGLFSGRVKAGSPGLSYSDEDLKKIFRQELPNYIAALRRIMPEDDVVRFAASAGSEFGILLKDLPYIGPLDYPLPKILAGSAVSLSFYRVMKASGRAVRDAGTLIVEAFKEGQKKYSEKELHARGDEMFTVQFYQIQTYAAQKSQQRMYPEDWVFNFLIGKPGSGYDWGWDFTECGVQKFFRNQGSIELLPYICSLDLVNSKLQDTGLQRTTTLYDGTLCDFRYKKGREVKL